MLDANIVMAQCARYLRCQQLSGYAWGEVSLDSGCPHGGRRFGGDRVIQAAEVEYAG
jgi:hypothetical protein